MKCHMVRDMRNRSRFLPLLILLTTTTAHAGDDPRALAPGSAFVDLVQSIATLVAAPDHGASTAGCILRRGTANKPPRLEASLAPGLDDIAPPPPDLDAVLGEVRNASLLTPSVRMGSEDAGLALVALTPVPNAVLSSSLLPVLVRTAEATWFTAIAPPDMFQGGGAKPERLDAAGLAKVRSGVLKNATAVVVAAEGATPIATLVETLALLDDFKGAVVLAMPIPAGVKVPTRPESGTARSFGPRETGPGFCGRDVGSIPPGQKPGEIPVNELFRNTEKLRAQTAKACEAAAGPSGGGVIKVAMRIGRDGRPGEVCVEKDSAHDEKLRACVIEAVGRFQFPRPVRGTFVNFGTDFTISPRGASQRGLCQ